MDDALAAVVIVGGIALIVAIKFFGNWAANAAGSKLNDKIRNARAAEENAEGKGSQPQSLSERYGRRP